MIDQAEKILRSDLQTKSAIEAESKCETEL